MSTLTAVPPMPEVTVPLGLLIPNGYEYYFNRRPDRPHFTRRAFEFRSEPVFLPLVHAFLNTCAAAQDEEYRYLFDLLGTELVSNAIKHTRSGLPGGTYTLRADRSATGLTLSCRDDGALGEHRHDHRYRSHLAAVPLGEPLTHQGGRGLALVETLASAWGDNGMPRFRQVWFRLDYDLAGSAWPHA
ncbi:ATP-binding protein [Streptomonospora algeriensis]|uniref:ATP-binding protein n=1 Tax=Streptomonospora algeriensis TaxID=995084 RepID=A0ABW3BEW0_9ACTN